MTNRLKRKNVHRDPETKIFAAAIGLWLFWLLVVIGFWIAVGFVIWHFVSKAW